MSSACKSAVLCTGRHGTNNKDLLVVFCLVCFGAEEYSCGCACAVRTNQKLSTAAVRSWTVVGLQQGALPLLALLRLLPPPLTATTTKTKRMERVQWTQRLGLQVVVRLTTRAAFLQCVASTHRLCLRRVLLTHTVECCTGGGPCLGL